MINCKVFLDYYYCKIYPARGRERERGGGRQREGEREGVSQISGVQNT